MAADSFVPNLVPSPSTVSAFEQFIDDRGASTEDDEPSRMAPPPEAAAPEAAPEPQIAPPPETQDAEPHIPAETPEDEKPATAETQDTPELAASDDDPEITSLQAVAEAFGVEPDQFLEAIQVDIDGTPTSLATALDQVKNLPAEVIAYRAQNENFENYDTKRNDLEKHYAKATQKMMETASTLAQVLHMTEPNWQALADQGMDANTMIEKQGARQQQIQLVHQIMEGVQTDAAKMQTDADESSATRRQAAVVEMRKMMPEWGNVDRFKSDFSRLTVWLRDTMEYSQESLDRIENPNDLKIAFMAMLLDQAKTTGATQFEKMKEGALAPTIRLTGHSRRDAPTATANLRQSALAAHRKNGTKDSAVELFKDMIPD